MNATTDNYCNSVPKRYTATYFDVYRQDARGEWWLNSVRPTLATARQRRDELLKLTCNQKVAIVRRCGEEVE